MKKIKLSVAALLIAGMSYGQTQCEGLTKSSNQCKNTVKQGKLCYLHNPNYKKPCKTITIICSGTTKNSNKCKNKTKNTSGLCHLHTKKD
tara:strand:+ start:136 stop:405 length:270 start_codon:yes stop_codon:yes gene_type:complete